MKKILSVLSAIALMVGANANVNAAANNITETTGTGNTPLTATVGAVYTVTIPDSLIFDGVSKTDEATLTKDLVVNVNSGSILMHENIKVKVQGNGGGSDIPGTLPDTQNQYKLKHGTKDKYIGYTVKSSKINDVDQVADITAGNSIYIAAVNGEAGSAKLEVTLVQVDLKDSGTYQGRLIFTCSDAAV